MRMEESDNGNTMALCLSKYTTITLQIPVHISLIHTVINVTINKCSTVTVQLTRSNVASN
jgi:hypothetical protein